MTANELTKKLEDLAASFDESARLVGESAHYCTPLLLAAAEKLQEMASFQLEQARLCIADQRQIAELKQTLRLIAEMDGDQPARSNWDMLRLACAALEATRSTLL